MVINVGKTQQVLLYSSVYDNIAHIAVNLQHDERFSRFVLLYLLYNYIAANDWKKCTDVMFVATQFEKKWRYSGTVCCAVQQ